MEEITKDYTPAEYYAYAKDPIIEKLCGLYGLRLEKLDHNQKLMIRLLLSTFLVGRNLNGNEYNVVNAWQDISLDAFACCEEETYVIAQILKELTVQACEAILSILQKQCTTKAIN